MKNWIWLVMVLSSGPVGALPQHIDLSKEFGSKKGCFAIKELGKKKISAWGTTCSSRYRPFSTFKILNSLIGLQTQALKNKDVVIKWNGTKYPYKPWEKDHKLATAIKYSVVPFYQEVARNIGLTDMGKWVKKVNYGNGKIGNAIDRFWLDGPLKVSAYEQVNFLEKLYLGNLPFNKDHIETVQNILILSSSKSRTFSGKTGTLVKGEEFLFGWFVGYLQSKGRRYVFAANLNEKDAGGTKVKAIVKSSLRKLKI